MAYISNSIWFAAGQILNNLKVGFIYNILIIIMDESLGGFAYSGSVSVPEVKDDSNRLDCGDSISTPARMDLAPTVENLIDGDNSYLNHTEPTVPSEVHVMPIRQTSSMGPERHQENQCHHRSRSGRRTNRQRQQVKAKEHKWFIRRTRSGQIYGKYPI
ncbi:hypothetical protein QAD02_006087 [Eretmocerus hayati]|uniref:Uncharacterized protein n=1 Tax=Eretmocerus hayati TaxID=131215 RepID=A0ACC2N411_9HYME|nr:hypothetical protein QAD02_006087 [Eretmocerus hayati]